MHTMIEEAAGPFIIKKCTECPACWKFNTMTGIWSFDAMGDVGKHDISIGPDAGLKLNDAGN